MEEYSVYVQVNPGSCVVALTSSALLTHTEGWVEVERGPGDRCHHPQSNYLPLPLYTDEGVPRYKLVEGVIVERTLEELEADLAAGGRAAAGMHSAAASTQHSARASSLFFSIGVPSSLFAGPGAGFVYGMYMPPPLRFCPPGRIIKR